MAEFSVSSPDRRGICGFIAADNGCTIHTYAAAVTLSGFVTRGTHLGTFCTLTEAVSHLRRTGEVVRTIRHVHDLD